MAVSVALIQNIKRLYESEHYRAEEKQETDFLHAQVETEAKAQSRARAQAESAAHASQKDEAEIQAQVQIKTQEEKEHNPTQRQDQRRQYFRSRQARNRRAQARRFRERGHEQGRRKCIAAVHHPVGCATVPPVSAVPLLHYFRDCPILPSPALSSSSSPSLSPPSSRLPPSSSLSSISSTLHPLTTPSLYPSRNADAEQVTQVGSRKRAEQLQQLYKSESAVHAHATALACGVRGVQPHGRDHIACCTKRDKDNSTSTAATIASATASLSGIKISNGVTAPTAGSRKLNAAAVPFVSNRNGGNQAADTQDTKNGIDFAELHHELPVSLSDYWNGCISAWELAQAFDPFHDITNNFSTSFDDVYYNNNNNVEITTQLSPRSRANPFPFSSTLSSFTPSLRPESPSTAALSPLESSFPSPDPTTKTSTSKESLSSFLAEESELLTLELAQNLRRQQTETELELALARETRQQPQKPQQRYEKIRESFVVVIRDVMRAISERVDGTAAERLELSPRSSLAAEKVVRRAAVEVEAEAGKGGWTEHEEEGARDFMLPPPALPLFT